MRAAIVAASLLAVLSAEAMVIECGDGTACVVDEPAECHCVRICEDGWVLEDEACPEEVAKQEKNERAEFAFGVGVLVVGAALALFVAILPAIIAWRRRHHQRVPILLLNIVGLISSATVWIFPLTVGVVPILWFVALVWALTAVKATDEHGRVAS